MVNFAPGNNEENDPRGSCQHRENGEAAVLIVDDDPRVGDVLQEVLKDEGFSVSYEDNGRNALHAIEREQPDLVLADMRMPVMDGITLMREISNRWNNIEVIMMSATESPSGLEVPFIQKPFDLDEVITAIHQCGRVS